MLLEPRADAGVERFDTAVEAAQHSDQREHAVSQCLTLGGIGDARGSGTKPAEQLCGRTADGVAVLPAEGRDPLLAEVRRGPGGRVTGEELQGDRRFDV